MKRKLTSVFIGIVLLVIFLELSIRVSSMVFSINQQRRNQTHTQNLKNKKVISIITIGESTTAVAANEYNTLLIQETAYPVFLEQYLNQKNLPVHFEVSNQGIMGGESGIVISELKSYLINHKPDIIVAMMGMKDKIDNKLKNQQTSVFTLVFNRIVESSRLYQFLSLFWAQYNIKQSAPIESKQVTKYADLTHDFLNNNQRLVYRDAAYSFTSNDDISNYRVWNITSEEFVALYYIRTGQFKKAEALLKKINNDTGFGVFLLTSLYLDINELQKAEVLLKAYLVQSPLNANTYKELIMLYLSRHKLKEAESILALAKNKDLQDDIAIAVAHSQIEREKSHFDKGINLLENQCGVKNKIEFRNHKSDRIKKFLRNFANQDIYKECTFLLSEFYYLTRNLHMAERNLNYFINMAPYSFSGVNLLRKVYEEQGKKGKAQKTYEKMSNRNQRVGEFFALADFYKSHQNLPEMNDVFERLKEKFPQTSENFQAVYRLSQESGSKLVIMQYPTFSLAPLKHLSGNLSKVLYVDNETIFDNAPREKFFFEPRYPYNFNHYTVLGSQALARHLADEIEKGMQEGKL